MRQQRGQLRWHVDSQLGKILGQQRLHLKPADSKPRPKQNVAKLDASPSIVILSMTKD